VEFEAFYTQEGVTIGLCKVIIASLLKELIVELEDEDTFLTRLHHWISLTQSR